MVPVQGLEDGAAVALAGQGYRPRLEPWNQQETSFGTACRKKVFAPARGGRPCNLHARICGGPNVGCALLFRDYLTADSQAASAWGRASQASCSPH
jgi:GrpB-like predicted nucleotidyltransferase (UPF0157 family)